MPPKRPTHPAPKRDRAASTRRILEAGLRTFAERGYEAATTRMIARRAGLNESLLHRYFKSKNGLLLAVLESARRSLRAHGPAEPPPATPQEAMRAFLGRNLAQDRRTLAFRRVVLSRMLVDRSMARRVRLGKPLVMDRQIYRQLLDFQKRGRIRPEVDVLKISETLVALSFSIGFIERSLYGRGPVSCRRVFDAASAALASGIAAPPPRAHERVPAPAPKARRGAQSRSRVTSR